MGFLNFFKGKTGKGDGNPTQETTAEAAKELGETEADDREEAPADGDEVRAKDCGDEVLDQNMTAAASIVEDNKEVVCSDTDQPKSQLEEPSMFQDYLAAAQTEEPFSNNGLETLEETEAKGQDNVPQPQEEKKGFFRRLMDGLHKTRDSILGGVDTVLGAFTSIDEELFEELEEVLIMADIGVETTTAIVEALRKRVKRERITDPSSIKDMLVDEIRKILSSGEEESKSLPTPTVLLVIGVNGVGKTTTIGKLASLYKAEGKKVLLAAADTFRAAAIDQLQVWGERSGIDVIRHEERTDPAAVVFDAVHAAKNRKADLLICDTAGRLHNKKNLMDELKKIAKVIGKEFPQAHRETYLVLDATTGQNAIQQVKLFSEVTEITGLILTKLDGTAKGGIVIAIKNEMNIPVKYIGVGEGISDLQKFDADSFAKALFDESNQ